MTIQNIMATITPIEEIEKINEIVTDINLKAVDNAVIHLAGAETVTGVKTFSSSPLVPTKSSGDSSTSAASTEFVTTADAALQMQIDNKANTSDVVNLTGAQTISGTKTFTGGININTGNVYFKEGGVYNNGSPSTNQRFGTTHYMDSADILRGYTHNYQNTSGDVITELRATNTVYGSSLLVGVSQSGVSYVQAPASDVSNSVVTTVNKSKSANGYFSLGNGLIIQWGTYFINNNAGTTITFPRAFSSSISYSVAIGFLSPDSTRDNPIVVTSKGDTGIVVNNKASGGTNSCLIVAIGY